MAFTNLNWVRSAAYGYEGSQVPVDFKYNGTADTKATILAADYFLPVYNQLTVGSFLQFTASDATLTLAMVTAASSSTVTISEITETLPPGSVDTADLADGAVTTAKLADIAVTTAKIADQAVTPAKLSTQLGYLIVNHTAAATATSSQAFSIPGILSTDHAYATMTAGFSQPIVGVVCSADTVTVQYAAPAVPTDTITLSVFRGPM